MRIGQIDNKKLYQLGIGIFGVLSVSIIYGQIYDNAISKHYENSSTYQKQIFKSEAGFIFVQQLIVWILIQLFAFLFLSRQQYIIIPQKFIIATGLLSSASSLLFTYSLFQLSFIGAFVHKNFAYGFVTLLGFITAYFYIKQKQFPLINGHISIFILAGPLIFWIYADQVWVFSQNKSGYLYGYMATISCLLDCFLSITQSYISQKYKPSEAQLFLYVQRVIIISLLIYCLITNKLFYTINFILNHNQIAIILGELGFLSFIGQFILYRITIKMALNVPLFIVATRNTILIHDNYALSRHKLNRYQITGMLISWISILVQAYLIVKKQQKDEYQNEEIETGQTSIHIQSQ